MASQPDNSMGRIFWAFGLTVLSLATIFANVLVLYVFRRTKKLRRPKYYCIISLAVADLLVGLISVNPYTVTMVMGKWPFGSALCQVWLSFDHTLIAVSNATLLIIAFDRFISICYPLSHRIRFTSSFILRCIIVSWVASIFVWTPAILIYPHLTHVRDTPGDCVVHFNEKSFVVTLIVVFFSYIAPSIVLISLYTAVTFRITKRERTGFIGMAFKTAVIAQPSVASSDLNSSILDYSDVSIGEKGNPIFTVSGNYRERSLTQTSWVGKLKSFSPNLAALRNNSYSPNSTATVEEKEQRCSPAVTLKLNLQSTAIKSKCESPDSIENSDCTNTENLTKAYCEKVEQTTSKGEAKCIASRIRVKKKALKWILMVSTVFIICMAPYNVTIVIRSMIKEDIPIQVWKFCYCFGWLNSLLNPICYAYANQTFNRSLKKLFFKR